MSNIQLLSLLNLVAVSRSAWCYAKRDLVKNKEVGLSEIVPPQANEDQPQLRGFTLCALMIHHKRA